MTLEDFFTLTEMKDGLTSHRVEELISAMQKDKESVVKNIVEAARQWSTVATTLAATENGDTLDHFVRLDGLLFLDRWLQDAQKSSSDDACVEESVSLLLRALEKLPVDNKRFISSGIGATVKKLLSHKSLKVQERARAVFDGWNQGSDSDGDQKQSIDDRVNHADEAVVASESRCETDGNLVENDQQQHSRSSDGSPSQGIIRNVKSFVTSNRDDSHTTLNHENKEDGFRENALNFSMGICSNSELRKSTKETTDVRNGSVDNVGKKETSCPSSLDDDPAPAPAMHPDVPPNHTTDAKEADCIEMPLSAVDDTCTTQPIESQEQNHFSSGIEMDGPDDVSHSDVMEKSSYNENLDDPEEACSSEKQGEASENSGKSGMKVEKGANFSVISSNMNTDMDEFDYGMDDALEVARQVAKQVEREVVHYREELCSSSSSESGSGVVRPGGSPDGAQDECVAESEDHLDNKKNSEEKSDPMVAVVDESKKGVCDIDLNEVFSEEVEHHHQSTITFVSASKVTPAGIPPKAPIHFEGELGWKGCAATSAFRPASARPAVSTSQPRKEFLDFDLNVAECCGDGPVPVPVPVPSGESSIEVSSRRAERLKLDLNRIGDNEDNPSSPASSSSSRQFPMRNIDLNGNPSSLFEDPPVLFGKRSSLDMSSFKLDDPVISIMGARVSVNRPDEIIPQTRSFLPNESSPPQINNASVLTRRDTNVFTRKADNNMNHSLPSSYTAASSMFGYNGLSMGGGSLHPAAMYGSVVPCMLDSRGAPVVPQMMMPSSSSSTSADVRPFFMSMSMGVPVMSLNGGMSRPPSFDLNSGFSPSDGHQLYIPGQQEQMNPAAGGLGMKRKEPEGGWDLGGYKHQPPWR